MLHFGKMRILSIVFLATIVCVGGTASESRAFGLGPYLSLHQGSAEFDEGREFDPEYTGVGIVLDTAVAKPSVFNYRLNLGYEEWGGDFDDMDIEGSSVVLDNTFGFKLMSNRIMRLWMGPQLHLSYGQADIPAGTSTFTYDDSTDFVGIGIGAVLGANFHLPVVSIAPTLGFRYQHNASDTVETTTYSNGSYSYESFDMSYDETRVMLNVNFLFRMGDRFE